MTFARVAYDRIRAVCAGLRTRKSPIAASFYMQAGVILSRQSQFKKGA